MFITEQLLYGNVQLFIIPWQSSKLKLAGLFQNTKVRLVPNYTLPKP